MAHGVYYNFGLLVAFRHFLQAHHGRESRILVLFVIVSTMYVLTPFFDCGSFLAII